MAAIGGGAMAEGPTEELTDEELAELAGDLGMSVEATRSLIAQAKLAEDDGKSEKIITPMLTPALG
jgi:hypothetical protein